MFAFSQILASGDKVSAVTAEIMKENSGPKQSEVNEDQAVLAFSDTLPGNDNEPKPVETDELKL